MGVPHGGTVKVMSRVSAIRGRVFAENRDMTLTTSQPTRTEIPVNDLDRRTLLAELVHGAHGVPQLGEPLVRVLADQRHAPRQRVGARTGHARVDERVEHLALLLA